MRHIRTALLSLMLAASAAACASGSDSQGVGRAEGGGSRTADESAGDSTAYQIDIWADNWMAVYVDGELIGEDSVPITTERSFNAETFTFRAVAPFTVAIEAKDFKESDSGLEYIGTDKQQMGDGGMVAQVTDLGSGKVVAATDDSWSELVVHRAPLNTECEKSTDPDTACESEIIDTPKDWTSADFNDTSWGSATEWTVADVGPKGGYAEIEWDDGAKLIWGSDLKIDNTILFRKEITA
ncbi:MULTISPECIES: hypothetical protein [unclassified Streptomyces]|uniref:hypothetical protein n=1 Tax=unclassified Streptomyces TaxID=2593676 RepID=UPI001F03CB59|nr:MULTISPECIES: hypothetical protein [unclassified Streptomyces]